MKICIKNATLISMDASRNQIENNIDILIDGNKIEKIARDIEIDNECKIIDATDKVVMPGLINTHAHVPMSIFRETLDGYTLQDWLSKKIWPMEDKLTVEDVYYASYLTFIEMIKTGSTTVNDMYFLTEGIIKAMIESGVRMQTTRTLMDINGSEFGLDRLSGLEELIKNYNHDRLTFNAGIHGLYTASPKYVSKCLDVAKKYHLPIHMHFCENASEVDDDIKNYQMKPIEVVKDKFKDFKVLLAHCVKVNEDDMKVLKDNNISVSHCPVSNLRLGCGIANISKMLDMGINVSLGTDGQGSGSNMDLFETMKYAALLQKGINENPKEMASYDVLKMATINGAKSLGLDKQIGSITESKLADIIIVDLNSSLTQPVNDLISEIVYNVKGSNVVTTIIDGKILMENKKLVNDCEKLMYKKCNEIINRIKID